MNQSINQLALKIKRLQGYTKGQERLYPLKLWSQMKMSNFMIDSADTEYVMFGTDCDLRVVNQIIMNFTSLSVAVRLIVLTTYC